MFRFSTTLRAILFVSSCCFAPYRRHTRVPWTKQREEINFTKQMCSQSFCKARLVTIVRPKKSFQPIPKKGKMALKMPQMTFCEVQACTNFTSSLIPSILMLLHINTTTIFFFVIVVFQHYRTRA